MLLGWAMATSLALCVAPALADDECYARCDEQQATCLEACGVDDVECEEACDEQADECIDRCESGTS